MAIISMAQQARPKATGQMAERRDHCTQLVDGGGQDRQILEFVEFGFGHGAISRLRASLVAAAPVETPFRQM
jgi:hypothetical protein